MLNRDIKVKLVKVKFHRHDALFPLWKMLIFGVVFAGLAIYLLLRSFAATPVVVTIESEDISIPVGASVITDVSASGGKAVQLNDNGALTGSINFTSDISSITIKARATQCSGSPALTAQVDGNTVLPLTSLNSTSWTAYSANVNLASGSHNLTLAASDIISSQHGNSKNNCTRVVYLDVTIFYGNPAPTVTLSASPQSVDAGESATLSWSSTDANFCTASGAWAGDKPTSGSESTSAIDASTIYTLTCTGGGGSVSASTTVNLNTITLPASGTVYYVDCLGSDNNNGLATTTPWKTLAKAAQATLKPGDSLLLKKGCTWNEQLSAKWVGTSTSPILISAYGTGSNPLIQRSAQGNLTYVADVNISGSYLIIENIRATVINPYRDASCLQSDGTSIPYGFYAGFVLATNSSYNTLRNLDASSLSVGITMSDTTSHNKLLNNYFHDMHYLWRLQKEAGGAQGSIGINLHGNDNEAAYNLAERNGASCTYSDGTVSNYSAPFEVYNANRNYVHHNIAFGHRKHFEMGHSTALTTDDNILAYNLFVSSVSSAVGPNIHGSGNPYGPVNRTQIYNNTIILTGANSLALNCDCSGGATIKNNILAGESKAAFYKGTISEDHNIYWDFKKTSDTTQDPFVQFSSPVSQTSIDSTSHLLNPLFIDSTKDWHLLSTSPAVSGGGTISTADTLLSTILLKDLDGKTTIRNVGAYVYP